jgi:putative ABC transport system ATP-binding protein
MNRNEPPLLAFNEVSKAYDMGSGSHNVLRDVSFEVSARQRIAIVGRSGSGKSTLLHLAAGIDVPSAGEITILGEPLSTLSETGRTMIRRHVVGLVFQFFYLLPHLSVRDNIALPALIAGDKPQAFAHQLSGGEMQRVAICRALLRRPKLLLADEPTGNLDDGNGRRVMALMLSLVEAEDSALVYVTHSREVADMADDVWQLQNGALAQQAALNTTTDDTHE